MYARRFNSRPFDLLVGHHFTFERVTYSSQRRAQIIARFLCFFSPVSYSFAKATWWLANLQCIWLTSCLPNNFLSTPTLAIHISLCEVCISCSVSWIAQKMMNCPAPLTPAWAKTKPLLFWLVGWLVGWGPVAHPPHKSSVTVGWFKKGEGSRFGRVENHGSAYGASAKFPTAPDIFPGEDW